MQQSDIDPRYKFPEAKLLLIFLFGLIIGFQCETDSLVHIKVVNQSGEDLQSVIVIGENKVSHSIANLANHDIILFELLVEGESSYMLSVEYDDQSSLQIDEVYVEAGDELLHIINPDSIETHYVSLW